MDRLLSAYMVRTVCVVCLMRVTVMWSVSMRCVYTCISGMDVYDQCGACLVCMCSRVYAMCIVCVVAYVHSCVHGLLVAMIVM